MLLNFNSHSCMKKLMETLPQSPLTTLSNSWSTQKLDSLPRKLNNQSVFLYIDIFMLTVILVYY